VPEVEIKNAIRYVAVLALGTIFFPLGASRVRRAPCVNLGPLTSRKLLELESCNWKHN